MIYHITNNVTALARNELQFVGKFISPISPISPMTTCKIKTKLTRDYETATTTFCEAVTNLPKIWAQQPKQEYERLRRAANEARLKSEHPLAYDRVLPEKWSSTSFSSEYSQSDGCLLCRLTRVNAPSPARSTGSASFGNPQVNQSHGC
jgi:hypothetical protein